MSELGIDRSTTILVEEFRSFLVHLDEVQELFQLGELSSILGILDLKLDLGLLFTIAHILILVYLVCHPFRFLDFLFHLCVDLEVGELIGRVLLDFAQGHRGHLKADKGLV